MPATRKRIDALAAALALPPYFHSGHYNITTAAPKETSIKDKDKGKDKDKNNSKSNDNDNGNDNGKSKSKGKGKGKGKDKTSKSEGSEQSGLDRWPEYVRFKREKAKADPRLKYLDYSNRPRPLNRKVAIRLMKFLNKYRPETRKQNKERMKDKAEREKNGEAVECEKIQVLKHGINHVAALIDAKKAKLVIIASDIEPSEIVMWLPGFCRKKGVPYTIVDNKLRLGTLVNKKAAPVVALTDIKTEDKDAFYILVSDIRKSTVEDNEAARKSHMRRGLYDLPLAAGLFSKYL